jgi:hypothetical protein
MQLFNSPDVLSDQRDRSVYAFKLPPRVMPRGLPPIDELDEVRICALWGIDRPAPLMVACLASLYVRDRDMLERIVAVREERGKIDFWCRVDGDISVKDVRSALADAVQAVMSVRWSVNAGSALPCRGTVIDWEQLPDGDPLRGVARSYGLGLHVKGGARRHVQS